MSLIRNLPNCVQSICKAGQCSLLWVSQHPHQRGSEEKSMNWVETISSYKLYWNQLNLQQQLTWHTKCLIDRRLCPGDCVLSLAADELFGNVAVHGDVDWAACYSLVVQGPCEAAGRNTLSWACKSRCDPDFKRIGSWNDHICGSFWKRREIQATTWKPKSKFPEP